MTGHPIEAVVGDYWEHMNRMYVATDLDAASRSEGVSLISWHGGHRRYALCEGVYAHGECIAEGWTDWDAHAARQERNFGC